MVKTLLVCFTVFISCACKVYQSVLVKYVHASLEDWSVAMVELY